jgi:sugar lactone lactonase YvrE
MQRKSALVSGLALALSLTMHSGVAWDRGEFKTLALLPAGSANPEALAIDSNGALYASTFGGQIHQFSSRGRLLRTVDVSPSSGALLDLAFHPVTGALLVVDFGGQQLLDVDPQTGAATVFSSIPGAAAAAPNALTFDAAGNVYVSDSFQGVVWRIGAHGGAPQAWVRDELLKTSGYPPFGANGLAFNHDQSTLYVANTGNDTIVAIGVDSSGAAQTPRIFAEGINGPDGLWVDTRDRVWVAANQANEIVVLDANGTAVDVFGDFGGIKHGVVQGLLFPSDLVKRGDRLYVVNFAVDLTGLGLPPNTTSAYARQVTRHSIAVMKLSHKRNDAREQHTH